MDELTKKKRFDQQRHQTICVPTFCSVSRDIVSIVWSTPRMRCVKHLRTLRSSPPNFSSYVEQSTAWSVIQVSAEDSILSALVSCSAAKHLCLYSQASAAACAGWTTFSMYLVFSVFASLATVLSCCGYTFLAIQSSNSLWVKAWLYSPHDMAVFTGLTERKSNMRNVKWAPVCNFALKASWSRRTTSQISRRVASSA